MKHLFSFVFIAGFMLSQPALAVCYTPAQYRAEQAIRYHTKMMTVGLYCQRVLRQNTYATYESFTQRNETVIRKQENLLVDFFRAQQTPQPEVAFHKLRTDLANKTSLQASKSIINFCKTYAVNFQAAKTMTPPQFDSWIERIRTDRPYVSSQPVCVATPKRT